MLTLTDCFALTELTPEEIDAIAEHEHVPEIVAVELGDYLVHTVDGQKRIKRMIEDDIAAAQERGDLRVGPGVDHGARRRRGCLAVEDDPENMPERARRVDDERFPVRHRGLRTCGFHERVAFVAIAVGERGDSRGSAQVVRR